MTTEATTIKRTEVIMDKLAKLNEIVNRVDRFSTELVGDDGDESCDRPNPTGTLAQIESAVDEITNVAITAMKKLERA